MEQSSIPLQCDDDGVLWDGNLSGVSFNVKHVNAHTIMNKWIIVDETANFALLHKEKKARLTNQCRIIVKGAKHFPLQITSGATVGVLMSSWAFIRFVDECLLPLEDLCVTNNASATATAKAAPPQQQIVVDYNRIEKWLLAFIPKLKEKMLRSANIQADFGTREAAIASTADVAAEVTRTLFPKSPMAAGKSNPPPPPTTTTSPTKPSSAQPSNNSSSSAVDPTKKSEAVSSSRSLPAAPVETATAAPQPGSTERPTKTTVNTTTDHLCVTPPVRSPALGAEPSPSVVTLLPPPSVSPEGTKLPKATSSTTQKNGRFSSLVTAIKSKTGHSSSGGKDKDKILSGTSSSAAFVPDDVSDSSSDDEDDEMSAHKAHSEMVQSWTASLIHRFPALEGFRNHFSRNRALTRDEWEHRREIGEQIRRNRTVAIMTFVTIYTLLMHALPFDLFLVLLVILQLFVFYVCTNYRSMAMQLAKRNAKSRIDRVKDWFVFGVRRKQQRNSAVAPLVATSSSSAPPPPNVTSTQNSSHPHSGAPMATHHH